MKLVGSKMESDFRKELLSSNRTLNSDSSLKSCLNSQGHSTEKAYVLHLIPEQTEDIYLVLIDGAYLVNIEIGRIKKDIQPVPKFIELTEYMHGLSKVNQIRLLVAQELANEKT
jgi:hypothetical protein